MAGSNSRTCLANRTATASKKGSTGLAISFHVTRVSFFNAPVTGTATALVSAANMLRQSTVVTYPSQPVILTYKGDILARFTDANTASASLCPGQPSWNAGL